MVHERSLSPWSAAQNRGGGPKGTAPHGETGVRNQNESGSGVRLGRKNFGRLLSKCHVASNL